MERAEFFEADWVLRGGRRRIFTPLTPLQESRMLTRPSLARSIPFWILFIGSLLSAALGVLMVVSNINGMASDIKAQSATATDPTGRG